MSRRTLLPREPLRRRPYGERCYSPTHERRRIRGGFRDRPGLRRRGALRPGEAG